MKKTTLSILLLISMFTHAWATVNKPYLEVPAPDGIFINWKSDIEKDFTIHYGVSSTNLNNQKTAISKVWSDNGYDANYIYNTVRLTGLLANTTYYYQISDASGYQSAIYSFRTYPAAGQSAHNGITRFLIIGDNQLKDEPRYDSMLVKAKRFIEKKYGAPIQEVISSSISVGDQVDVGTLDHYENVLFKKTSYLSPNLGMSTIIGNHETYGTLKLNAYTDHFHYDSIMYKVKSNTENYYAYQAGKLLVINLNTEAGSTENAAQTSWLQQVVSQADADPSVEWIVSTIHRPFQAEQYVGDISSWFRNTAYPILTKSAKMFMVVGAHHHLYARGQDKNVPVYNIISGGTAWDQYWGMSTEQDCDDVQKTITRWAYQILEINDNTHTAKVSSYSIGYTTRINDWGNLNKFVWEESLPIDSFYVTRGLSVPQKPSISNPPATAIELPYQFISSPYATGSGQNNNSTQFQIASDANFSSIRIDKIRDFENLFGQGAQVWETADANSGVDIFSYTPAAKSLPNGTWYIRVRHRDRALNWSAWSDAVSFVIINGSAGLPVVSVNNKTYQLNENIVVNYQNGPGNTTDWVGIYKSNQTPGPTPSVKWAYVNKSSLTAGTLNFSLNTAGEYYAAFLEKDGYNELAERAYFYVGKLPAISMDKAEFKISEPVRFTVKSAPANATDWLGIYKIAEIPKDTKATAYQYITSDSASYSFNNLPKGYYFARYFLNDSYSSVGDDVFFSVGDTIATISTDKNAYDLGDLISVTFADGPGKAKDWLGIYHQGDNPNIDPLLNYTYVGGKAKGQATFTADNLPKVAGNYYVVFFTNDSYNAISNKSYFSLRSSVSDITSPHSDNPVKLYPNPMTPGKETVVEYHYPIHQIDIADANGRLIYCKKNMNQENTVILNHNLPAGIYMVKVYSNTVYTVKLIVNNDKG